MNVTKGKQMWTIFGTQRVGFRTPSAPLSSNASLPTPAPLPCGGLTSAESQGRGTGRTIRSAVVTIPRTRTKGGGHDGFPSCIGSDQSRMYVDEALRAQAGATVHWTLRTVWRLGELREAWIERTEQLRGRPRRCPGAVPLDDAECLCAPPPTPQPPSLHLQRISQDC